MSTEFAALAAPYRSELLAHCYRMLGSIHDAEDLVQETYLRAWRSYDRFEGRSSLRQWMYKIATMACLTAIAARERRALPSGLGAPVDDHRISLAEPEPGRAWLGPAPDRAFDTTGADPATVVAARAGVRLAFVAALQELSARQRAALILRDVVGWRSAQVADILDTSPAAVNSALHRARAQLRDSAISEDELVEPEGTQIRALLERYVTAFERSDLTALVATLRADVELEMPPIATWFTGREAVGGFLAAKVLGSSGDWRLIQTRANRHPAVVAYHRRPQGGYEAHGLHVLTVLGGRVSRIIAFLDPGLTTFAGLPAVLDEAALLRQPPGRRP